MLAEIYIEALLIDEDLADQVWGAWDKGEISDFWADWALANIRPAYLRDPTIDSCAIFFRLVLFFSAEPPQT